MSSGKEDKKGSWPRRKIPWYTYNETSFHIDAKNNDEFATQLEQKLEQRLLDYDRFEGKSKRERFVIFSQCFEEIILHHSSYAPLLSDIKHEYENCIETVFRGEKEAAFLYRNLTSGVSGPRTLENYKGRIQDLKEKKRTLRRSNACLKTKSVKYENKIIAKRFTVREELHNRISHTVAEQNVKRRTSFEARNREFRIKVLNRYSASEQTNLEFLNRELQRLRGEIQELVRFFDKRFKLREMKDRLVEKLMEKEKLKGELQERWAQLKEQLLVLETKIKEEREFRDVVMCKKPRTTIQDLILMAIQSAGCYNFDIEAMGDDRQGGERKEDPLVDQDHHAEMVEYMEIFEKLFTQGNFEEAAIVAATSPQEILRTAKTFQRFKVQRPNPGEIKSPLIQFCEAVIVTSTHPTQTGLSASESIDAVERALQEGHRDLLVQWVSQSKLKFSESLGETILRFCPCGHTCACGCCMLAEVIFRDIKAHGQVVYCLCRQGRLLTAVHYGRNVAKFRKLDFMGALRGYPRFEHAVVLLQVSDGYLSSPLCREECLSSLVRANKPEEAAMLLTSPHDRIQYSKMVGDLRLEDWDLWMVFQAVLKERGFLDAAYDIVSALVLAETFYCVHIKLSL